MSSAHSGTRSRWVKALPYIFVGLAVAAVYPALRWGLRAYTDHVIDAAVGQPLPRFELADREGTVWTAERLRGRTTVLHFFRSKCHACRAERDEIAALARELDPERVVLLGIMVDRVQGFPEEVSRATLAEFGYQHPVLMADAAFVNAFHGVGWAHITPITYVVSPDGVITDAFRHPYTLAELRTALPS